MMEQIENVLDQNANFIHNNEVNDLVDITATADTSSVDLEVFVGSA